MEKFVTVQELMEAMKLELLAGEGGLLKKITSEQVSDEQMAHAAERFPINTPMNKEAYYYRSIFEEYFPSESAARSVPSVPSVACSTAEALAWDKAFQNMNEPSGRAVAGVHEASPLTPLQ